LNNTRKTI